MKQDENDVVQDVGKVRTTFVKVLVKLDIWINDYLLFGKSETLSARMGRSIQSEHPNPMAVAICDFLDVVQKDHCKQAYQALLDKQKGKQNEFEG